MDFNKHYSKEIIEQFALQVLKFSFDLKYGEYFKPSNEDNFDYISPDKNSALEITSVRTENEIQESVYEKHRAEGRKNLDTDRIIDSKFNNDGSIKSYYGGSISELISLIRISIDRKQRIAVNRLANKSYKNVDLCICINDGGLLNKENFELAFNDLNIYIFRNIFFITSLNFISYSKRKGFKEYKKIYEL